MADYQQIVDRVRAFITAVDQTRTDAMAETASAYGALCDECNLRLRRCIDYLRRGLRSEAIHLAESEPPLLELVAALDLPEIEQWEQLCAAYELARPSRMMIDLAQELNEAYAQHQPFEHLLKRHRRLALARAPIGERLQLVRELSAADPENACWSQDQEALEVVRLAQLRQEVPAIIRARNADQVQQVANELLEQPWRVEIPADLTRAVEQIFRSTRAQKALHTLNQLSPQLQTAISEADYPTAKALVQQWKQIIRETELELPPAMADEYEAARAWTKAEEQNREQQRVYQEGIVALKLAIDTKAPEDVLRVHRRTVRDSGYEIPAELDREYRRAIAHFDRGRRMEKLIIAGVILLVLIVIVGLATMSLWSRGHGSR